MNYLIEYFSEASNKWELLCSFDRKVTEEIALITFENFSKDTDSIMRLVCDKLTEIKILAKNYY